jgi:3',5'-cyclic AMP phosphodiesterase CpdA
VFNDTHSRVHLYPPLLAKAGASVDFAVLNGDVLNDPQSEKDIAANLLAPMAWFTSRGIPCFFLRGNHETRGAAARTLKGYLTMPDDRYYTAMTVGATRLVLLDCGEDKPDASKEYSGLVDFDPYMERQLAWLEGEIAAPAFKQAAWRIVVVHIPPDWRKAEDTLWHGERRMRERFAPLFDKGKVTAVISGHTHKAELIEPCPDPARGFRWPVFIGGAHPLANATVIRVDADDAALTIKTIRSDGDVLAEKCWRPGDR